jgi:hypothetical protein
MESMEEENKETPSKRDKWKKRNNPTVTKIILQRKQKHLNLKQITGNGKNYLSGKKSHKSTTMEESNNNGRKKQAFGKHISINGNNKQRTNISNSSYDGNKVKKDKDHLINNKRYNSKLTQTLINNKNSLNKLDNKQITKKINKLTPTNKSTLKDWLQTTSKTEKKFNHCQQKLNEQYNQLKHQYYIKENFDYNKAKEEQELTFKNYKQNVYCKTVLSYWIAYILGQKQFQKYYQPDSNNSINKIKFENYYSILTETTEEINKRQNMTTLESDMIDCD